MIEDANQTRKRTVVRCLYKVRALPPLDAIEALGIIGGGLVGQKQGAAIARNQRRGRPVAIRE